MSYQTQTKELAFATLIVDLVLGPTGKILGEAIGILDNVASDFACAVVTLHEVAILLVIIAVGLAFF